MLRDRSEAGPVDGNDDDFAWSGEGALEKEQGVQSLDLEEGEGKGADERHGHEGTSGDEAGFRNDQILLSIPSSPTRSTHASP